MIYIVSAGIYHEAMQMIRAIVASVTALLPAGMALAQEVKIDQAPEKGMGLTMTIVIVLCLGLLVASFTSSRRGHQD